MITRILIALTLVFGFAMPAQSQQTLKLPIIPDCNIKDLSCDTEYFNLFVEFKSIKEFYDKEVISKDIYDHYKKALDKLDAERLYTYQQRFIDNQKSYFVEIPDCTYDSVECIEKYQSFFSKFQQAVLLCNQGELDREMCLEYVGRIQKRLQTEIESRKQVQQQDNER